jgi:hypothetical protein
MRQCEPRSIGVISIRRRPFNDEEDETIRRFVRRNGAKLWNILASELDERTPKQCRERWYNHLDPSIEKGPWTEQEDLIIAEKHAILGNKWAEIARFLPGRSDARVKNRWKTTLRRRDPGGSRELEERKTPDSEGSRWMRANIAKWLQEWEDGRPPCVGLTGERIPPLIQKRV